MVAFAVGAGLGGLFPQVCTDGISASCLSLEWQFKLPASQYVHNVAGLIEFAGITFALGCAVLRSKGERTAAAGLYRWLAAGAIFAYPLLVLAVLLDKLGGVMEAVFFAGFTAMVVTQLIERTRRRPPGPLVRSAQSAGAAPSDSDGAVVIRGSSDGAARARLMRQRGMP